ncbi:MAG: hypothetical protein A2V66_16715 [Ignavibacteria bacterium RBG_13_36_8]|nr:MAG: hypothetical protein A2V66_16715 [Ignavibacteria bacterium RBG_13_36_8]
MTEEILRKDFIKYLKSEGIEVIAEEFGVHGSSIFDCVYLDKKRRFIAVELKLTDWKKVIDQAMRIKKHVPLVYVAMPLPATINKRDAIEEIVKKLGLGLYGFNSEGNWICHSSPDERTTMTGESIVKYFEREHLEKPIFFQYHFTFIAPLLGKAAKVSRGYEYKNKKEIW